MTSEEIAKLRALNRIALEGSSPALTVSVYVPHAMLARLLDEREALLEALKKYAAIVEGPTPSRVECVAAYEELVAVIAKAEAP